jgi:diguanylate cyclase (GGDEF)-like protein
VPDETVRPRAGRAGLLPNDPVVLGADADPAVRPLGVRLRTATRALGAVAGQLIGPVTPGRLCREVGSRVLSWRDATGNQHARRELGHAVHPAQYKATHDALTGLPNRVLLQQRLTDTLACCPPGEQIAVVICDLRDLAGVNGRHGEAVGDALLQATANRLRAFLGPADTAARLAGDEFALVLPRPRGVTDHPAWLAALRDGLSQPVAVRGTVLAPAVSLGLVLGEPGAEPGCDADGLLALAYQALHRSRAAGRPVLNLESVAEAERARLDALAAYDIHHPGLDQLLRAVTQVAAGACDTELSLVTFIDAQVQWVRAANTLDLGGSDELFGPRHLALCDHTIRGRSPLVIPNLRQDPRYRPSRHARWQLGIGFYAGAPLITPDGRAIGSLCVLDSAPTTLSDRQLRSLTVLADETMALLEARRVHPGP